MYDRSGDGDVFCGTWYLPHSHVHNEQTVPIIMTGCIAHARNGRISTSSLKSDATMIFDPIDKCDKCIATWLARPGQVTGCQVK